MIFNDAAGCGATVMCYPAPAERYTADTESFPADPDTCGAVVAVAELSTLFENPTNSGPIVTPEWGGRPVARMNSMPPDAAVVVIVVT